MQDKSNQICCNGDCNQGRDCPLRHQRNSNYTNIALFVIIVLTLLIILEHIFK